MSGFLIGAIVVVVLWIFVSMSSKTKAHQAFNALDAADPWLTSEGILPTSVRFSSYSASGLSKHPGATVLVGQGKKQDGSRVGFVLEVLPDRGVVDAVYIQPDGIITHHRTAVQTAQMSGHTLSETLQQMAQQHRQRFPGSGNGT